MGEKTELKHWVRCCNTGAYTRWYEQVLFPLRGKGADLWGQRFDGNRRGPVKLTAQYLCIWASWSCPGPNLRLGVTLPLSRLLVAFLRSFPWLPWCWLSAAQGSGLLRQLLVLPIPWGAKILLESRWEVSSEASLVKALCLRLALGYPPPLRLLGPLVAVQGQIQTLQIASFKSIKCDDGFHRKFIPSDELYFECYYK